MSTKTEERLKKLLYEQHKKQTDMINDRIGGVFLYGVFVGIIISYSGFMGYISGVGSGIIITTKYNYISEQILDKTSYIFSNILKQLKNDKTQNL